MKKKIISFKYGMLLFLFSIDSTSNAISSSQGEAFLPGIDISHYQGDIDFSEVKQTDIKFIFVKATDGVSYIDPKLKGNVSGVRKAGITLGVYHYYETNDDPNAQLEHFTNVVSLCAGDLPPVVDIERLHKNSDKHLAENLLIFLDGLHAHYGALPIIYSGIDFANKHLSSLSKYPLWVAEYEVPQPRKLKHWTTWRFWQWSQTHTISGIGGNVDANRFNGNESDFIAGLIRTTPPSSRHLCQR